MKQVFSRSVILIAFLLAAKHSFAQVTVSITHTNVLCNATCTGTATASVTGGTGPYTYSWSPSGATIPNLSGLCAGTYTCTVTDATFASGTATVNITQPAALSITFSSTQVACYNGTGNISAIVFGGTAPYTYNWMPGNYVMPTISNVPAASYTCNVTDAAGCTTSSVITLTQPSPITANTTSTPSFCGNPNGTATCNPSGGTTPYTYYWNTNPVQTTQTATGLTSATYTCTVTDANGCTYSNNVFVPNANGPTASISSSTNVTCFGGIDGSATSIPTGGTGPYSYSWAPSGGTFSTASGLSAGGYTVTITDANGCTSTASVVITQPPPISVAITSSVPAGCNQSNGSATGVASGGVGVFSYSWAPVFSASTTLSNISNSGTYSFIVTDANGCTATATVTIGDSCNYVWPGDANEDAVADNNDILAIGIANGATGTTRANATTTWIGQPSTDWGQTFISGTDYKFADCDGNGTIQPADTNAVVANFGFTHNMRMGSAPVYDATLPDLTVTLNQSQIGSGSPGSLSIALGSSTNPANNVYGLAFTLNFDPALIDASSFGMNNSNCWMGTVGTDLMGVVLRPAAGSGFVEVAITRLDHNNASGSGNIADLGFNTTSAFMGTFQNQDVIFSVSNVNVISANETSMQVNMVNDTVNVCDPGVLGMNNSSISTFSVYPNPVKDELFIAVPSGADGKNCMITITDAAGRVVSEEEFVSNGAYRMQMNNVESGIYFCALLVDGHSIGVKKLIVE